MTTALALFDPPAGLPSDATPRLREVRMETQSAQLVLVPDFDDPHFLPHLYDVREIEFKAARRLIEWGHYTHSLTKGRHCFGLFRSGFLVGCAVYGQPSGRNVARSIWADGDERNTLELLRLFVMDGTGKNAESWFMARCTKALPSEVRLLVAYSAPVARHYGGCYQAGNWLYIGRSKSGQNYYYSDRDGNYVNKRIPWQYGPRSGRPEIKEREAAEILGLTRHPEARKLTYVYPRDRRTIPLLKREVLPYPKPDRDDLGMPEVAPRVVAGGAA